MKTPVSLSLPVLLALLALTTGGATGCTSSSSSPADATVDSSGDAGNPNNCMLAGFTCVSGAACPAGAINVQDLQCLNNDYCCQLDAGLFGSDAAFDAGNFPDSAPDGSILQDSGPDSSHGDAGHDAGHDASHPDASHDASTADHSIPDAPTDAPRG